MKHSILLAQCLLFFLLAKAQIITTIAGIGNFGYNGDGIPATMANLADPAGVTVDATYNVYITEVWGFRVRKIDHASGIITTIAGTGTPGYSVDNIPATAATLDTANCTAIDDIGNLYICDDGSSRIRKVDTSGIITTIAGSGVAGYGGDNGLATLAKLNRPSGVAVDRKGNIYISDGYNNRIRKVDKNGIITTYVGTGIGGYNGDNISATTAKIFAPDRVSIDKSGNLYFGDLENFRIRKVDTLGIISTIAGNGTHGYTGDFGPATDAEIGSVGTPIVDENNNVYFEDAYYNTIRRVDNAGIIITVAGNPHSTGYYGDGLPATEARLCSPLGIALDASGSLYIADDCNQRVRYVKNVTGVANVMEQGFGASVYPNPSNGKFTILLNQDIGLAMGCFITNIYGQKIKEINVNSKKTEIYLEQSGTYFLTIMEREKKSTQKIIVETN